MAHQLETAHISFGLVTIPVGIYSAIEEQDLHFHQLHALAEVVSSNSVSVRSATAMSTMMNS